MFRFPFTTSNALRKSTPVPEGQRLVLAAVGALGVSCVMTQLALMRELLGAFSGNEMVLGVVLGLWLLLMGIGAWLGRTSEKLRSHGTPEPHARIGSGGGINVGPLSPSLSPSEGERVPVRAGEGSLGGSASSHGSGGLSQLGALFVILILVAMLPLAQVFLLRALRNVVFIRGAAVGVTGTAGAAFVLLLPYCLVAGYALTLACSILARESGPAGIGRAYIADSIGSIVGGVVFSFVLVRFLDHIAILVFPALLNLLLACLVGLRVRGSRFEVRGARFPRFWFGLPLALGVGLIAATLFADPDGLSTRLQYPRQHVVARANSPYGKLIVTESDGQFDFIENGIPITSTRDDQHVEETVHYAMAQRPEAGHVLLVCGGISGTAREVLKYGARGVDYVELDPLILALGKRYLSENLADKRIRVVATDGRLFVKQTAEKYDVVIVDIPAPAIAQLNRFYTVEFLAEVKRVLTDGGVVSFTLGDYENYISAEQARMLSSACLSLKESFRNVRAIPGSRVIFLASDGPLFADIAARIEQRHVQTRLVNRHYLDAMLTADRTTDLASALAQPAALNQDFSPILYYYHLRHWMSQFNARFGLIQVGLLLVLGFYLVRLRGSTLVLFASGFAASALEVVLLLAFQVLCGSVYYQVGVIVTVFMAGLALGASIANRFAESGFARLSVLAFLIAGYAILLPLFLPCLNYLGGSTASLFFVKSIVVSLTLVLAVLVGMQFPLANRAEFDGTVAGAARLYTADFVGAFLGASLACTLLIPLIGVTGVCLLTALLNAVGGLAGRRTAVKA
jgi:spermidine synthase